MRRDKGAKEYKREWGEKEEEIVRWTINFLIEWSWDERESFPAERIKITDGGVKPIDERMTEVAEGKHGGEGRQASSEKDGE